MTYRVRRYLVAITAPAVLAACARPVVDAPAPERSFSVITHDQIVRSHFQTAYDAVEALHSNWLQQRGTDSFIQPGIVHVYMDDVNLGGVDELQAITPASVAYIQFYDAIHATQRWGLGHTQGVIYVSSSQR
jgi:hypothetical protein